MACCPSTPTDVAPLLCAQSTLNRVSRDNWTMWIANEATEVLKILEFFMGGGSTSPQIARAPRAAEAPPAPANPEPRRPPPLMRARTRGMIMRGPSGLGGTVGDSGSGGGSNAVPGGGRMGGAGSTAPPATKGDH